MTFLLDTCSFLWMVLAPEALSPVVQDACRDPTNDLFLSAASTWEITIKHGLGRLSLPDQPERFVLRERTRHSIESLVVDEEAALRTSRLPHLHRDPFDRMLVSQAIGGGMTILTPDEAIARYPIRTLW